MSRIRANNITNRLANGAPTAPDGLVISGVTTITTLDLNGDLDVDGHLNADNVSIAGVATATTLSATTGTFGDFGVWSFDAMKILVTGDGGLIYAQKQTDIEKLKRLTYLGLETPSGLSNTIDKK